MIVIFLHVTSYVCVDMTYFDSPLFYVKFNITWYFWLPVDVQIHMLMSVQSVAASVYCSCLDSLVTLRQSAVY